MHQLKELNLIFFFSTAIALRNLVKLLRKNLCSYLSSKQLDLFTLDEMATECKSDQILTPSEVSTLLFHNNLRS